jgi:hypothetical protein
VRAVGGLGNDKLGALPVGVDDNWGMRFHGVLPEDAPDPRMDRQRRLREMPSPVFGLASQPSAQDTDNISISNGLDNAGCASFTVGIAYTLCVFPPTGQIRSTSPSSMTKRVPRSRRCQRGALLPGRPSPRNQPGARQGCGRELPGLQESGLAAQRRQASAHRCQVILQAGLLLRGAGRDWAVVFGRRRTVSRRGH